MKIAYEEYNTKKIINVHKHVDGPWFWGKYTANPYIGCRSGCEFCYLRGGRYLSRRDPDTFDSHIQVKVNAITRMRKEIKGLPPEIISVGDWQQPVESRYLLSRGMLEVVLDSGFPLFIVERSPLVIRDLDLLVQINRRSWVGILFSISSLDQCLKRAFEPHSPGIKRRLKAMETLALSGITVGTSMMPVFPFVGDDDSGIEDLILATKDHGGSCVLAGGLTMDGAQAEWTLRAAQRYDQGLEKRWRNLYNMRANGKINYSPPKSYSAELGLKVRELCNRNGIPDRMPRYIIPGPLEVNKHLAEKLFLKTYDLELEMANSHQIWAYRKAAWTVDELPESIAEIYLSMGKTGLLALPNIGPKLAAQIARWLDLNIGMKIS
jgi:DNA repair photolyase